MRVRGVPASFLHELLQSRQRAVPLLRNFVERAARGVELGGLEFPESFAAHLYIAYEAGIRMRDRFLMQEVWERMDIDVRKMVKIQLEMPNEYKDFQKLLFSKIVPNCKKLGLLDAGDGWLRKKWTELGVIEYEDWANTGDEYLELDAVAADRAAGAA